MPRINNIAPINGNNFGQKIVHIYSKHYIRYLTLLLLKKTNL